MIEGRQECSSTKARRAGTRLPVLRGRHRTGATIRLAAPLFREGAGEAESGVPAPSTSTLGAYGVMEAFDESVHGVSRALRSNKRAHKKGGPPHRPTGRRTVDPGCPKPSQATAP